MQRQLQELSNVNEQLRGQLTALGVPSNIRLPLIDVPRVANQLSSDLQCLIPNLGGLLPDVSFTDISFGSICEGRNLYGKSLFLDPTSETFSQLTPTQKETARQQIRIRRSSIHDDAALKALAGSDTAMETAANLNEAAAALSAEAGSADDLNSRMAVNNQGLVLMVRAQAQTNIILAQILKLQASRAILGLGTDVDLALPGDDGGDQ